MDKLRREIFHTPQLRRNRVWQVDFTEYETLAEGRWRVCSVVDYATRFNLCSRVSQSETSADATAAIKLAIKRAEQELGMPLARECSTSAGACEPITIVTDNGSAFTSVEFKHFVEQHGWLQHVQTRIRQPKNNGRVERFNWTLKYDCILGRGIKTGKELNINVQRYRIHYNRERPHQAINDIYPVNAYRATPTEPDPNILKE